MVSVCVDSGVNPAYTCAPERSLRELDLRASNAISDFAKPRAAIRVVNRSPNGRFNQFSISADDGHPDASEQWHLTRKCTGIVARAGTVKRGVERGVSVFYTTYSRFCHSPGLPQNGNNPQSFGYGAPTGCFSDGIVVSAKPNEAVGGQTAWAHLS